MALIAKGQDDGTLQPVATELVCALHETLMALIAKGQDDGTVQPVAAEAVLATIDEVNDHTVKAVQGIDQQHYRQHHQQQCQNKRPRDYDPTELAIRSPVRRGSQRTWRRSRATRPSSGVS